VKGRTIFISTLPFILLFAGVFTEGQGVVSSKDHGKSPKKDQDKIPFLLIGDFIGRTGTAFGHSIHVEIAPPILRGFGLYVFVSRSEIRGYKDHDGVTANFLDVWAGPGVVYHFKAAKGIRFAPFFQTGYSRDNVNAFFPDGQGGVGYFRQKDELFQATVGLRVEHRLPGGIFLVGQFGKNIEGGPADHTWAGATISGGILVDPFHFFKRTF
jgi:hypothetical protein